MTRGLTGAELPDRACGTVCSRFYSELGAGSVVLDLFV